MDRPGGVHFADEMNRRWRAGVQPAPAFRPALRRSPRKLKQLSGYHPAPRKSKRASSIDAPNTGMRFRSRVPTPNSSANRRKLSQPSKGAAPAGAPTSRR